MDDSHESIADFRPVPLWSWNDSMDPVQCGECLNELMRAGYGGGYLHPRLGMTIPFMSSAYLRAVEASVTFAKDLNISAHLYDEDRWPSGWAGGSVPLADPAFRTKALIERSVDDAVLPDSRLISARGEKQYFVVPMELGHFKFNGTCYTDLTNSAATKQFLHDAYEPLLNRLGERFGRDAPTIFSDEPALTYLYTWPRGGLPWSDELPARFKARTGTDLATCLGPLFHDVQTSAEIRSYYYRILAELFIESFMKPISHWCRQHRIRWTGHFMYEHSLPLHFSWSANCHPAYRYFDWPGIDHLGRQVGEVVTALGCRSAVHQFSKPRMMSELFGCSGHHLSFADRKWIGEQQIVLGVNHLVPHLMSTTMLGPRKRDYPPTFSPHQSWWKLNHFVEQHLTRLCQIIAGGKATTDLLVIHPQESTYVLSRGPVPVGDANTWTGRFFHEATNPELGELDTAWKELSHRLLDRGYVFDFGDESIVAEFGRVEQVADGVRFCVGDAEYRGIVIPPLVTMRESTLTLIVEFARAGGTVAQWGEGPRYVDGRDDLAGRNRLAELRQCLTVIDSDLAEVLSQVAMRCAAEISILPADSGVGRVWRYTKTHTHGRLTFVVNLDRLRSRSVTLKWRLPPDAPTLLWNTDSFTCRHLALEDGKAQLDLQSGESCVIVEGNPPAQIPVPLPAKSHCSPTTIHVESLSWKTTRMDENALLVDQAYVRLDDGEWRGPFPALAIKEWLDQQRFVGRVHLQYEIATAFPQAPPGLRLIVEGIDRLGIQVGFNGHVLDIGAALKEFWRDPHWHPLEVDKAWVQAKNIVEVQISKFQFGDPASADAALRTGTEIEPIIVLGEFHVTGTPVEGPKNWCGQIEYHTGTSLAECLPPQPLIYLHGPFVLEPHDELRPYDAIVQGLPFYSGRLHYVASVQISERSHSPVYLELNQLLAPVAEISVNGEVAGIFAWPPYRIDVSTYLRTGVNQLEITLYHSLRNLMGPHHHPVGEPVYVNPGSFRPEGCENWLASLERGEAVPNWEDRYAFVSFGLLNANDG